MARSTQYLVGGIEVAKINILAQIIDPSNVSLGRGLFKFFDWRTGCRSFASKQPSHHLCHCQLLTHNPALEVPSQVLSASISSSSVNHHSHHHHHHQDQPTSSLSSLSSSE
ncbi:hypothetical protein PGT21_024987 [Puccinia graminis f. sp. tritici]|uniref:Uncharacterized protein n=1 Tax=Puccinia graminis f. sp. tritici TaxID=56615 RepID=A0A5B0M977_PUCGR|nr:hypothetical protein PGT21_024987 [Puccinia graminis f. sp. tritici]